MVDNSSQIVYVLTNPAMPGLVKIGKTTRLDVDERMEQLGRTAVPVPFDCAFDRQVKDASEVEKALHFSFGNGCLNPNRAFFRIEAERVVAVLKLFKVGDITIQFEQQLDADVGAVDKQSALNLNDTKRPRMNFHELDIPNGSVLVSKDGQVQVIVVGEKKVTLNGNISSLTAATRKLLGLPEDYPIQPSPHRTFNGKTVNEIYEAFHCAVDGA